MVPPTSAGPAPSISQRLFDIRDLATKSDVGRQPGVKWSLSSHKPGNGVQDLLHPDISRLWQSDGTQPHFINIQFPKRTPVTHVAIYLDHKLDDSYTPTKILIKGGTYFHDLVDIRYREFTEPSGWKNFIMVKPNARVPEEAELESYTVAGAPPPGSRSRRGTGEHADGEEEEEEDDDDDEGEQGRRRKQDPTPLVPIHAWLLQICILGNHLNGKDTHVRGIHIFGPPQEVPTALLAPPAPLPSTHQQQQQHGGFVLPAGLGAAQGSDYASALRNGLDRLLAEGSGSGSRARPSRVGAGLVDHDGLEDDDGDDDDDDDDDDDVMRNEGEEDGGERSGAGAAARGAVGAQARSQARVAATARRRTDDTLLPPLSRNLLLGSSVR
ncbi:hypothetical protein OC842_006572 [Tilletia horrida]|uniref:DOC domain-containing protein n=1 Tax=Tilletia horrida TaxID=155126 RepID=A0AAN6G8A9_9BASI|nr:hypothetical protein OC842_006572 [Tilletia horrida]